MLFTLFAFIAGMIFMDGIHAYQLGYFDRLIQMLKQKRTIKLK